ncbi:zinc-binding dehydrogenase [Chloroflexota bacterium]
MKSLRLHSINDLRLHEESTPIPEYDEALLRVKAVGICGSDIHWFTDGGTGEEGITTPFVLGHEFGGVVDGGSLDGLRVAVDPAVPCDTCEYCLNGKPNLCPDHYFAGHAPHDGALREYMAWPMKTMVPVPDSFSDEDIAVLEPLGVAIHNVDLGHIKPGMTVGVYGCGPIGLLTIQVARAAGASEIIATDVLTHRLEVAKAMGAGKIFLASTQGSERTSILTATHQDGVDVAFEVAGENAAVETAIETVKPGGRVVLCGIPSVNKISFNAASARRKGLSIMMVRRMKHVYPRAIRMVEAGQVDIRSVVSHRFSLEKASEAFDIANKREGLKVIINP